jgi:hypothetical protein
VIAYGIQCKHELAQDGCFVLKKWDEHWFQANAVKIPELQMTFDGTTGAVLGAGMGVTYQKEIDDMPQSLSVGKTDARRSSGDSNSENSVATIAQADKRTTGDMDESLFVCGDEDEPDDSQVVTEMNVDSNDDTMTLASLQHTKPAAKPLYKYNYSRFIQDCAKLATAVQNRPQVAESVHGTIVTLLRIAQGQQSEIDNTSFYDIIEGAHATFGEKNEFTQAQVFLLKLTNKTCPYLQILVYWDGRH